MCLATTPSLLTQCRAYSRNDAYLLGVLAMIKCSPPGNLELICRRIIEHAQHLLATPAEPGRASRDRTPNHQSRTKLDKEHANHYTMWTLIWYIRPGSTWYLCCESASVYLSFAGLFVGAAPGGPVDRQLAGGRASGSQVGGGSWRASGGWHAARRRGGGGLQKAAASPRAERPGSPEEARDSAKY